ncbi:ABC transporter ATP-binding protein [Paralimibaculum aggregatum]|uniref:ABC transporter ATP-binding protein n=1 Tax=Paralimibaculum aggregatum TaxID=3036245 RepID=A0ABQ6LTK0_9RHOB|nr:ABC transporter ATP-binding protein [Limibaculum sp. NKW23]GMG85395.1 ABC transporter ATP-binding protein [Limibaculum sp. NKW23]
MLEIRDIDVGYGGLRVLQEFSIRIARERPAAVLGTNGAGKTTLCRTLSGLLPVRRGQILFDGEDVTALGSAERVRRGIVQVPEGRQVFPEMSVLDNLRLGAFVHGEPSREEIAEVHALFPILAERSRQNAGLLSGGEQQMLALGRALMTRPRLLILDEPSQGLAPKAVDQVGEAVRRIAARGVAILLVEQNLALAEMVAEHAFILETGRCVRDGPAAELLSGDALAKSYLGI